MFERDYLEGCYMSNLNYDDYNLDIREDRDVNFQEQDNLNSFFAPEYLTNDEFLENFMKIGHGAYNVSVSYFGGNRNKGNESFSTHSSQNLNNSNSRDLQGISTNSGGTDGKEGKDGDLYRLPINICQQIIDEEKPETESIPSFTKHKKGRPMADSNVIIDEVNNKVYDPNEDPIEYKKARKRMQNRESAVRSRQKKKESSKHLESENEYLRMENYRLFHENKNLKQEKSFLIDQIKFMQNLIRSNNIQVKPYTNCKNEASDIEKNLHQDSSSPSNSSSQSKELGMSGNVNSVKTISSGLGSYNSGGNITLNGGRQRSVGKLFSVFIICVLSIAYISFDAASDFNTGDKIVFSSGSTMTLKDASDRGRGYPIDSDWNESKWAYLLKVCFILFTAYVYWNISAIYSSAKQYIMKKREKFNKRL